LASDGSGGFDWQGAASASVKQLVQDFVVASGESVSVGDVVSFLDGEVYSPSDQLGSESVFNTATTYDIDISSLSTTKFVVAYRDSGNSSYGTVNTGTNSGGSVNWGTESVFNTNGTFDIAIGNLSSTEFVIAYRDGGNANHGTAITGTISGGSLSWGNESVFNAAATSGIAVSRLSSTEFVVAYRDDGYSNYGMAILGTVSGGSLSWGGESAFNEASTSSIGVSSLSTTEILVAYQDDGNFNYGTAILGTVSGANLGWGTESVFNAAATYNVDVSSLSPTEFVVAYTDNDNSIYGIAIVGYHWRLIGTAKTAAGSGEMVTVIFSGVSDVHAGLEPGCFYYLQSDGSLGILRTDYRVGLAISETELILDPLW